jgi:hypothetical protein
LSKQVLRFCPNLPKQVLLQFIKFHSNTLKLYHNLYWNSKHFAEGVWSLWRLWLQWNFVVGLNGVTTHWNSSAIHQNFVVSCWHFEHFVKCNIRFVKLWFWWKCLEHCCKLSNLCCYLSMLRTWRTIRVKAKGKGLSLIFK